MAPPAPSLTRMTGGSAASRGLNGRASHPRNPQTKRADSSPLSPTEIVKGSCPSLGGRYMATSGALRMPGVLDIACPSPCGKTTMSPAVRRMGVPPWTVAQQLPCVITW